MPLMVGICALFPFRVITGFASLFATLLRSMNIFDRGYIMVLTIEALKHLWRVDESRVGRTEPLPLDNRHYVNGHPLSRCLHGFGADPIWIRLFLGC